MGRTGLDIVWAKASSISFRNRDIQSGNFNEEFGSVGDKLIPLRSRDNIDFINLPIFAISLTYPCEEPPSSYSL